MGLTVGAPTAKLGSRAVFCCTIRRQFSAPPLSLLLPCPCSLAPLALAQRCSANQRTRAPNANTQREQREHPTHASDEQEPLVRAGRGVGEHRSKLDPYLQRGYGLLANRELGGAAVAHDPEPQHPEVSPPPPVRARAPAREDAALPPRPSAPAREDAEDADPYPRRCLPAAACPSSVVADGG